MTGLREACRTILRPWCVAFAILGLAVTAITPSSTVLDDKDDRVVQSGVDVAVWTADGPLRRSVALSWIGEDVSDGTPYWTVTGERFGLFWLRSGGDPSASGLPQRSRPPGAPVALALVTVGLIWWVGPPTIASATGLFFLRRRGGVTEPTGEETRIGWRLARAWIGTFAPLGVLLVISGHRPDATYWSALGLPPSAAQVVPAGTHQQPTRSLFVWRTETKPLDRLSEPPPAGQETRWGDARYGLSVEQSTSIWRRPGGDRVVLRRGVLISVWWLVAPAVAGNLVTLIRLIHRRGAK